MGPGSTARVLLAVLLPCAGAAAAGDVAPLSTRRVASGLDRPVFVTHAPMDETHLFVLEQRGVIKILDLATETVLATPFLDIDPVVRDNAGNDERGLLGLAFHPDYQANGFFYVNYIDNDADTVIARYSVSADPLVADAGSALEIMFLDQPFPNHNAGWMGFGPNDGYFYIATGDGGSACDPGQRAQDLTDQKLGKILRIDIDGGSPYAIPPGNPFVGVEGDDEIWAYGLRNPWRCSFDRATGDLYIGDVGQKGREEINYQPAASPGGENYGWDCREGTGCANDLSPDQCAGTKNGCVCDAVESVDPAHEYDHGAGGGSSVTGGYVYRGCAIPSLQGTYFFADFRSERIWSFRVVDGSVTEFAVRTAELSPGGGLAIGDIASFGEDANGEVYILDRGETDDGEIYKIVARCPGDLDGSGDVAFPDLLAILANWGRCGCCSEDLDGNGTVAFPDLLILLASWGPCP